MLFDLFSLVHGVSYPFKGRYVGVPPGQMADGPNAKLGKMLGHVWKMLVTFWEHFAILLENILRKNGNSR